MIFNIKKWLVSLAMAMAFLSLWGCNLPNGTENPDKAIMDMVADGDSSSITEAVTETPAPTPTNTPTPRELDWHW